MTNPKLLLPLRIPELGPCFGKLVTGTGRAPGGMTLDELRYRLVTRLIERAGEARRLSANQERGPAVAALGRETWLSAWEETVRAVADALVRRINERLEGEAKAVRMPRRLRRRVVLDPTERRALGARLGCSGAILIPALDALQRQGEAALAATALERNLVSGWQESLKTAARKLEAAWLALEESVEAEGTHWGAIAERVAAWRRPMWPVFVVSAIALAVAIWLGLAFGGWVPSPNWLVHLWERGVPRL
jgi:hypothetical protein